MKTVYILAGKSHHTLIPVVIDEGYSLIDVLILSFSLLCLISMIYIVMKNQRNKTND